MGGAHHWRFLGALVSKVGNVSWLLFLWLSTILLTFLILEYFLNMKIIRMRTFMSREDERNFWEAKGLVQNRIDDKIDISTSASDDIQ
jgi:sensor domain CHASE-containing protein